MKKNLIFTLLVAYPTIFLFSCQQLENSEKINKATLKMSIDDGEYNRVINNEILEMRCDCTQQEQEDFINEVSSNTSMAVRYMWVPKILQKKIKEPLDSLPDLQTLHQKVQTALQGLPNNSYQYKMLANWAGYGAIKVYFLRIGNLSNEQKQTLGEYVQLLVEQKNMNLPELADALEKLEGFWSPSQVRTAANAILANEAAYNNPPLSTNGIGDFTTDEQNIVTRLIQIDEPARAKLKAIAERNI